MGYLYLLADFNPPYLHLAPPRGFTPVEFRGDFWRQHLAMAELLVTPSGGAEYYDE